MRLFQSHFFVAWADMPAPLGHAPTTPMLEAMLIERDNDTCTKTLHCQRDIASKSNFNI